MPQHLIIRVVKTHYTLILNPVTGSLEKQVPYGKFETREQALAYYQSQLAPAPYTEVSEDHYNPGDTKTYRLSFIEGPLKWYNPLTPEALQSAINDPFGHGLAEVLDGDGAVYVAGKQLDRPFGSEMQNTLERFVNTF